MSDQENMLPDATENQSTEVNSVEKEVNEKETVLEQENETPIAEEVKQEPVAEQEEDIVNTADSIEEKVSGSQEAVDAIEEQMAKSSENSSHEEVKEIPLEDYSTLSLEEIVSKINELTQQQPINLINKHVDALKKEFNTKFGALISEAKAKFSEEEHEENAVFYYENPIQKDYNRALLDYKNKRKNYYKEQEQQHEDNLHNKLEIIEELKKLIEEGDASSMYNHFQDIQKRWRETGPVSRNYYSDTWKTYHFHVDRFYDLLHLRNDLRDLDFKHNLAEKMKLVEKAEELAEIDDINKAFSELQSLHRIWKEEVGPVGREHREEIWNRFSEATKKIHDKKHQFYEELQAVFEENFLKKEAVINEILNFDTSSNKTHRDWQNSMKMIEEYRNIFFSIGKVPRTKNKEIWRKFKEATSSFNTKKNEFYKDAKRIQKENLDRKMRLVEIAESFRESDDWSMATETMKRIQTEWKTIGHVPRKMSDKIWNRFREACNHYFDRLHAKDEEANAEKFAVYQEKKTYLEALKTASEKEDFAPTLEDLKTYIKDWREMGAVPRAQHYIDVKFNKFLDPYFEKLSLNRKEGTMLRYRSMIDGYVERNDYRKISDEIQYVRNKIDSVTKDKQQLENNMQFFSNTDDSNPMFKNIKKTLQKHVDELEGWKDKLQYLRTIEV